MSQKFVILTGYVVNGMYFSTTDFSNENYIYKS